MCLFYHMIDVPCYNAFVLFTSVDLSWSSNKSFRRRLFLEQVGRALIAPAMANRSRLPRGPHAAGLVLQVQRQACGQEDKPQPGPSRKRRQYALCPQRRKVWKQCTKCGANVCQVHLCASCLGS